MQYIAISRICRPTLAPRILALKYYGRTIEHDAYRTFIVSGDWLCDIINRVCLICLIMRACIIYMFYGQYDVRRH